MTTLVLLFTQAGTVRHAARDLADCALSKITRAIRIVSSPTQAANMLNITLVTAVANADPWLGATSQWISGHTNH